MKYRYEIATAGLIHDIGKLYQKSVDSPLYRKDSTEHPLIARDFVERFRDIFSQVFSFSELDFICECAVRHHTGQAFSDDVNPEKASADMKKYCNIINYADNISSGERKGDGGIHGNKECAVMHPILTYSEKSKYGLKSVIKSATQQVYKLTKYSDYNLGITSYKTNGKDLVYHSNESYIDFINEFEKDIRGIKASTKDDFFNKLMFVIRDYTWCVPSDAADEVHDISLYQHLVTTSGIAVALYSNADSENFFNTFAKNVSEYWNVLTLTLNKADEFIFDTSTYGINLLNEIGQNNAKVLAIISSVVSSIIDTYGLTDSCILIQNNSFEKHIIVPSSKCADIENYLIEVNKYLFNEFEGKLLFNFGFSKVYSKESKMKSLFTKQDSFVQGIQSVLCDSTWNSDNCFILKTDSKFSNLVNTEKVVDKELLSNLWGSSNKFAIAVIDADKVIETMQTGFEDRDTISRIATYSSILSDFFDKVIADTIDDCYIININANRVILICNSDTVLENVTDIIDTFTDYTNDKLTLSVVVKVFGLNQRLFSLADSYINLASVKESGGNAVYYNDITMTYDELQDYISTVAMIIDSVLNGTDKSILHKLKLYGQMYQSWVDDANVKGLRFYTNFRGNPKKFKDCSEELLQFLTEHINAIGSNPKEEDRLFYMLKSIAYDSELRLRGEE